MPPPSGLQRWWLTFALATCFCSSVAAYHQLSCPTTPSHVIQSLDSHQASTVSSSAPAVLITAGPGTGKTHVLAARLQHIIEPNRKQHSHEDGHGEEEEQNKYWAVTAPESVLVLSFSKGGAKQVVDRAIDMGLSRKLASRITSTTFHGMSASMLRRHCKTATGMSCFSLASDKDQDSAISLAFMKAGLRNYSTPVKKQTVLRQISLWKDLGLGLDDISGGDMTAETDIELAAKAAYALYNANLRTKGLLDHGDLPMLAFKLLQKEPNILSRYRLRLQHILVDEFQDVGAVQYALLRLLVVGGKGLVGRQLGSNKPHQAFTYANNKRITPIVAEHEQQVGGGLLRTLQPQSREVWVDDALHHDPNAPIGVQVKLFCAADEDQRIYAWRGAAASHLHRFCVDFPGSERHSWAMTHRLPLHILSSAGELLQANHKGTGRRHSDMNHTVKTKTRILGARISVKGLWSSREEGKWIARQIKEIHAGRDGEAVPHGKIAVLIRCWSQAAALEECLVAQQIPYSCGSGGAGKGNNFFARDELMIPLALLRLCLNPYSNTAFDAVLSSSSISRVGCDIVRQMSRLHGLSLLEAANRLVGTGRLNPDAEQRLSRLVGGIQVWTGWIRAMEGKGTSTDVRSEYDHRLSIYWRIFYEAGYLPVPPPLHLEESDDGKKEDSIPDQFQSVKDLSMAAAGYDSLAQFLLHTELDPIGADGRSSTHDAVQLLSMHQAKGKEYDVVFLPGWEEGIFPLMPNGSLNKERVEGSNNSSSDDGGDDSYDTFDKKDWNTDTTTAMYACLEEERRLAYVALTRARRNVVISYTRRRRMNGQWLQVMGPSRFLSELPTRHLSVIQPNGGIHTTLEAKVDLHWDMIKKKKKDKARDDTEGGDLPQLAQTGEDLMQSSPSLRPLEGFIDLANLLTTNAPQRYYHNDEAEFNKNDSLSKVWSSNDLSEKKAGRRKRSRATTPAVTPLPHQTISKQLKPSSWRREEVMLDNTGDELGTTDISHKIQKIDRNEMKERRPLDDAPRDNMSHLISTLSSRKRGRPRKDLLLCADIWKMILKLEGGTRTVKKGANYATGFDVNAIKKIQKDGNIAQASLKAFFREALSIQFGIHRGSIPNSKHHGKERISISRASSKQLGSHLISLLQLQKDCQGKKT